MSDLLGRHGTLLDVSIERWLVGELSEEEKRAFEEHISAHAPDAARVRAAEAEQASFEKRSLPSFLSPSEDNVAEVIQFGAPEKPAVVAPRRRRWATWGGLALAAVALFAVGTWMIDDPESGIRFKGGLELEVIVDDGEAQHQAAFGDTVAPGDRLGFRVRSKDPGYLIVVGIDDAGSTYSCYPQTDDKAREIVGQADPVELPTAVRLDEKPGVERLIAVRCPNPFAAEDLKVALARTWGQAEEDAPLPRVLRECEQHEVLLRKEEIP
jgi:hypothetical protein